MDVQVVTYKPQFGRAFAELNYEWIERYFAIEEIDRKALDHPEVYAREGEIFFVLINNEPVGTVAMVPYSGTDSEGAVGQNENEFGSSQDSGLVLELAKMAVRPDMQGKGLSRLLMQACLDYARSRGAREVMLQTNDVLTPALKLYERFGFRAVPRVGDDRYSRSNLEMRLTLS